MGTPSHLHFKSDLIFSGFDQTYIFHIHELIFEMVWHSNGRFSFETLYYMPVYLREFYLKKINQKLEPTG
jgi:hypothetical protein